MNYLSLEDILAIRDALAATREEQGDGDRYAIRNVNGLLSALNAPSRAAFGAVFYPTLADKAAALLYALVENHAFYDGNKRIAAAALRLFLARNNAALDATAAELTHFTRQIALGDMPADAVARWVQQRTEQSEKNKE